MNGGSSAVAAASSAPSSRSRPTRPRPADSTIPSATVLVIPATPDCPTDPCSISVLHGRMAAMSEEPTREPSGDQLDELREKAREHIADLPAETALGNADP